MLLFVKAAEVKVCFIDNIIGKKLLWKVKIIIGSAIATITMTIINVLLSICMLVEKFNSCVR